MAKLNTLQERKEMRLIVAILGAIFLCAESVAAVLMVIWMTNWYRDMGCPQSWVVHVAIWLMAFGFVSGIYSNARNIGGYQKKWVHWTKWED